MPAAGIHKNRIHSVTESEKRSRRSGGSVGGGGSFGDGRETESRPKTGGAGRNKAVVPDDADACGGDGDSDGSGYAFLFGRMRGGEIMTHVKAFLEDERGITTVEIILILVTLISLVIIFKKQLTTLVNNIFKKIVSQSNSI